MMTLADVKAWKESQDSDNDFVFICIKDFCFLKLSQTIHKCTCSKMFYNQQRIIKTWTKSSSSTLFKATEEEIEN